MSRPLTVGDLLAMMIGITIGFASKLIIVAGYGLFLLAGIVLLALYFWMWWHS